MSDIDDLFDAADEGDPDAIAMVKQLLSASQSYAGATNPNFSYGQANTAPFFGQTSMPSMSTQITPALGQFNNKKTGAPDFAKNLNFYQDVTGETADPITAANAGGDAFAPGTFQATRTPEAIKTPKRILLERYASAVNPDTGLPTSWEGVVAQALLEDKDPTTAYKAAKLAMDQGLVEKIPNEFLKLDPVTNKPTQSPESMIMDFATQHFQGLAEEPEVNRANVSFNEDTGQYETLGPEEKTQKMEEFDKLGLPYPTEEYTGDWLRQNSPEKAQQYAEADQTATDADAMLRSLRPTVDARGNWLEGQGPAESIFAGAKPGVSAAVTPKGSGGTPDTRDWGGQSPVTKAWWQAQDALGGAGSVDDSLSGGPGGSGWGMYKDTKTEDAVNQALAGATYLFRKPGQDAPTFGGFGLPSGDEMGSYLNSILPDNKRGGGLHIQEPSPEWDPLDEFDEDGNRRGVPSTTKTGVGIQQTSPEWDPLDEFDERGIRRVPRTVGETGPGDPRKQGGRPDRTAAASPLVGGDAIGGLQSTHPGALAKWLEEDTAKRTKEKRRASQFNTKNTNKKIAAINARTAANTTKGGQNADMWILSYLQNRTPYGDAAQARQNQVQAGGGSPYWGL